MKIKISLSSNTQVKIQKDFLKCLQAIVYKFMDLAPAHWLHDHGFKYEKRSFKLFTFSSLLEKGIYDKSNKQFIFPEQISFIISSPVDQIIEQIAQNMAISEKVQLDDNNLSISSIELIPDEIITTNKIRIQTLTPIEVHSTLLKFDGTKKTYYYSPAEKDFSDMINANLKKKWFALYYKF